MGLLTDSIKLLTNEEFQETKYNCEGQHGSLKTARNCQFETCEMFIP